MQENRMDPQLTREHNRVGRALQSLLYEPGYIDFRDVYEVSYHLPMSDGAHDGKAANP